MTAAMTSDFNAVSFGDANQRIYPPVAWVVPHLRDLFLYAAHGMNDITYDITCQGEKYYRRHRFPRRLSQRGAGKSRDGILVFSGTLRKGR